MSSVTVYLVPPWSILSPGIKCPPPYMSFISVLLFNCVFYRQGDASINHERLTG